VPGRGDPRARLFMCEGVAEPGTARGRRPDAAPPLTCPCGFRLRRKKNWSIGRAPVKPAARLFMLRLATPRRGVDGGKAAYATIF
jgi:hypothetical protein